MLFSTSYLQALKQCLDVKIGLAGYGSYVATSLRFHRDCDQLNLRCMMLYKKVLDKWDNTPGATNAITEEQFAAIVAEIEKMPYGCDPGLLQSVVPLVKLATNKGPVVDAGLDRNTGASSITLQGTAYDPEGIITEVLWTKLLGGAVTITSGTTLSPVISGMSEGSYVFQLAAKDDSGNWAYDTVVVTCTAATVDLIYYGGSSTKIGLDIVQTSSFKVPYKTLLADGANDVTINWLNAYSGVKYPWVLIPARTLTSIKSRVYVPVFPSFLNMNIETTTLPSTLVVTPTTNLFTRLEYLHPEIASRNFVINGIPYVMYLGNWPTILNSTLIFKYT